MKCQKVLSNDEIGLHKKLYNRAAKKYMCIECSAKYLDVTVELLEKKITEFKRMGCTLFK